MQDIVSKTTKLQDKLTAMITKKESTLKEKGEAEGLTKAKVLYSIHTRRAHKKLHVFKG